MEIRRGLCYIVVNCVIVCCIAGKPFSLNALIEAESRQKQVVHTTISPKLEALEESEPPADRFSLNRGLKPLSRISNKFKETGTTFSLIPLGKIISPLKYRKTFQIKSPLKPKRVKHSLRTRHKRKNQPIKTEVDGNAILNQKYIPLLKSLGMLFDNILSSESGEATENKRKRFKYFPEEIEDVTCKCPHQRESNADSESEEKTATFSETLPTKVSVTTEITAQAADNTPDGNFRGFRQNKNVPLLLSRNTLGSWRNYHGLSERSSATHNGSAERHISGDHGDSEYDPERGQGKFSAESDEEHTDSTSRNYASGFKSRGGIRGIRGEGNNSEEDENDAIAKEEAEILLGAHRRHIDILNGQDKLKTGRDKAKSTKLLPEPVLRQRESIKRSSISKDQVSNTTESVQSKEDNEESELSIALDSSGNQRFFDRDGSVSTEDKKTSPRHETVTNMAPELNETQYYSTKYTKSSRTKGFLPEFRKLGSMYRSSDDEVGDTAESEQSAEDNEKSALSIAHNSFGDQRVFDRDASLSLEDHETRHEVVTHVSPGQDKNNYNSRKTLKTSRIKGISPTAFRRGGSIHLSNISQNKVGDIAGSVEPEEDNEESEISVAQNNFGDQRIFDADDSLSSEDQKASSRQVTNKSLELDKSQHYSSRYGKTSRTKGYLPVLRKLGSMDRSSEYEVSDSAETQQSEADNKETELSIAQNQRISGDQRIFDRDASLSSENRQTKHGVLTSMSHKQYKSNYDEGSVESEEDNEESAPSVAQNSSGDQRIFDADDSLSSEDQKASSRQVTNKSLELDKSQHYSSRYGKTSRTKGYLPVLRKLGSMDRSSEYEVSDSAETQQSEADNKETELSIAQNLRISGDQRIFDRDASLSSENRQTRHGVLTRMSHEQYKSNYDEGSVESEEDNEESAPSVAQNSFGDQRIFDGDGSLSSEDQKATSRQETVTNKPPELDKSHVYYSIKYGNVSRTNTLLEAARGRVSIDLSRISVDKVGDNAKSVESKEDNEESKLRTTINSSGNQRIVDRDGLLSSQDQKVSSHETVTHKSYEPYYNSKKSIKTSRAPSPELVRNRGLIARSSISDDKGGNTEELVQFEEENETSNVSVPYNSFNDQQLLDRYSSISSEDLKPGLNVEPVTHLTMRQPEVENHQNDSTKHTKSVVIFDGYSVTRHKNGENKLSEKAIRIHT